MKTLKLDLSAHHLGCSAAIRNPHEKVKSHILRDFSPAVQKKISNCHDIMRIAADHPNFVSCMENGHPIGRPARLQSNACAAAAAWKRPTYYYYFSVIEERKVPGVEWAKALFYWHQQFHFAKYVPTYVTMHGQWELLVPIKMILF